MPIDPSIQRKAAAMADEIQNLNQQHKDAIAAGQEQLKNKVEMLKAKKQQMLDAEKKREDATHAKSANEEADTREDLTQLVAEATGQGGFDYEKTVNDKLKKHGKADKGSKTAGSSADAPDAKFKHDGKEHNLEIKKDHKAMFGQIELHHDGKKWDISDNSKKKYPHTAKAITDTGFLHKVNKQWKKPSGDYNKDLQMGNVYHTHDDAEPIKHHYGKDRKTDYIQVGGHGFYHTGKDEAKLGSPELHGKTQLRARMKNRGTDKKTGKTKYGALVVMGLKDADKSHHDLDAKVKKEWYEELVGDMLNEARGSADKHWSIAQDHKEKASLAVKGSEPYHSHMVNHHESMSRYHEELGQSSHAQAHEEKAESHHEKAMEAAKSVKESDASWAASLEKKKEDRLTPNDKDKLNKVRAMLAKEKKPVKEAKYWSKTGKTAKHNETGEETHEYAEYDDEKGEATGKREYRNAKGKSMGESVEQIDEISKELAGNYYGKVNQQHVKKVGVKPNMYDRVEKDLGKKRKEGLDRAFNRLTKEEVQESALERFRAAAAERMKKHDDIEAKRKEEAEKGKENMSSAIDRLAKKVNEAHKIGDKVVIHKGPKDVVGKVGHVGEIRKRYAGDTKTYTIDHDQGSIQLKPTHFKSFKEDLDEARMSAAARLQRAFQREQEKSAASRKRAEELLNPPKKPEPVKESWYTEELTEDAKCFVHGYEAAHTGAPKKNPYEKGTKDYTEYEDGYAQGELARRRMQTEATNELSNKVATHKHSHVLQKIKNGEWEAMTDVTPGKHVEVRNTSTGQRKMVNVIAEEGEGGVPANNAGDGKIAGFAGDAGKKAVMTKKPLQRKTLQDFKKYVSQEHEEN
jgi:hypothetical protein